VLASFTLVRTLFHLATVGRERQKKRTVKKEGKNVEGTRAKEKKEDVGQQFLRNVSTKAHGVTFHN
jgi:hypothetical protein